MPCMELAFHIRNFNLYTSTYRVSVSFNKSFGCNRLETKLLAENRIKKEAVILKPSIEIWRLFSLSFSSFIKIIKYLNTSYL